MTTNPDQAEHKAELTFVAVPVSAALHLTQHHYIRAAADMVGALFVVDLLHRARKESSR